MGLGVAWAGDGSVRELERRHGGPSRQLANSFPNQRPGKLVHVRWNSIATTDGSRVLHGRDPVHKREGAEMRVHLVWGLRRPQLGLETAAAARYCRMTILQMCVLVMIGHSD